MPDYTILLIDYEPRSVQLVKDTLVGAGFRVETAADGLKGIETFNTLRPDLTLVEAMLPKKHGFEVCQHLKTTSHGAVTPVAIITAVYKGRKYRNQALHHYKADEYLEKPIDPELLLTTVRRLLDASPAARPAAAVEPEPSPAAAVEAQVSSVAAAAPAGGAPSAPIETSVAPPTTEVDAGTAVAAAVQEKKPHEPAPKKAHDTVDFGSAEEEINERIDSLFS